MAVTRIRQDSRTIGSIGGAIKSSISEAVATFPGGATGKDIKVGLQVRDLLKTVYSYKWLLIMSWHKILINTDLRVKTVIKDKENYENERSESLKALKTLFCLFVHTLIFVYVCMARTSIVCHSTLYEAIPEHFQGDFLFASYFNTI